MPNQRTSSIPNVLVALNTKFSTWLATSGVDPNANGQIQVSYGMPIPKPERECVIIGGTESPGDQKWWALGNSSREETYDVALAVMVERPASSSVTQLTVTQRAFTIFGVIETQLRASQDPLALASSFEHIRYEVATPSITPTPGQSKFLATIDWALRVTARI